MATANEIEIRVTVDDKTKAPFAKIEGKLKADAGKMGDSAGQEAGKSFSTSFGRSIAERGGLGRSGFNLGAQFAIEARRGFEEKFGEDARFNLPNLGSFGGGLFSGMFDRMKDAASSAFSAIGSGASQLGGMLGKVGGPLVTITALLGGVGAIAGPAVVGIGAIAAAVGGTLAVALGAGVAALGLFNVKAREAFTALGEEIQTSLARLTDQSGLTAAFQRMADVFRTTFRNLRTEIKDAMIAVQPHLDQLAAGFANFANTLVPRLATALKGMGPVFEGFKTMLGNLGVGIGDMFIELSEHAEGFKGTFEGLGEIFRQVLPALGEFMGVLADEMGPTLRELAPLLAQFVRDVGPMLADAIRQVRPHLPALFEGFKQLAAAIIPLIPDLTYLATLILPPLADAITLAGEVIRTYLIPAIEVLAPVIENIIGFFTRWVGTVKAGMQLMSGDVQGAMQTMTEVTNGTFMQMPETANAGFEAVRAAGQRGMQGLNTEVTTGFQNAVEGTMTGTQNILNGILGFQGRFESGGRSLGEAFKRGIISQINAAVDAVQQGVEQIAGLFGNSPAKWGPFSGRGYALYRGQRLMEAFAKGIKRGNAKVKLAGVDAMGNMAFSVFGSKDKRGRRGPLATGSISTGIGAYSGAGAPSPSMLRDNYKRQNKAAFYGLANGSAQVHVSGDADGAIATMISKLIRTGKLRVQV